MSASDGHKLAKRWRERARMWQQVVWNWLNGLPTQELYFDPDAVTIGGPTVGPERSGSKGKWLKRLRIRGRRVRKETDDPAQTLDGKSGGKPEAKTRIFQVPVIPGPGQAAFCNNAIKTAKYGLLTFAPKNLYEQFHRVANFYFLLVIILQCIPAISNVSPWIAMMPLTLIVIVTAIKDGLEDWKRHRSDNQVNYAPARVLKRAHSPVTPVEYSAAATPQAEQGGLRRRFDSVAFRLKQSIYGIHILKHEPVSGEIDRWKSKYWRDIAVGDLLLIKDGEPVPADILVVSTSETDGRCFIETMNLDGETNLKIRGALPETQWVQSVEEAVELQMLIECELPSNNMHSFAGKVILPRYDSGMAREDVVPIGLDEVAWRGCTLRNTAWIVGCVVYTGQDTKLMLNTGVTPSKRSRIERQMNPQIILSFLLLFVICFACAVVQTSLVASSAMSKAPYWYSSFGSKVYASALFTGFLTFWSSMVLFQTLVPISLYITVEVCKTVQVPPPRPSSN